MIVEKNNRRLERGVYFLFACFCLWMAAQIPYTHDDWDWGLPIGIQQLISASINGRYAGNFLEVVMTRSGILKTLIMGSGYFLIPFLIANIAFDRCGEEEGQKRLPCFLMAAGMFLAMDRWIWQQTCGWVAGYANFVVSAIFMLVILKWSLRVFDDTMDQPNGVGRYVLFFAVSLTGQLFLENVALYLFLLTGTALWIGYQKTKRISRQSLIMTVGAAIGLVLIFSSGIYKTLWDTGKAVGGYRQLYINSNTGLSTFVKACVLQASKLIYHTWEGNFISCLVILVLLTALLLQKTDSRKITKVSCAAINALWFCYFTANHFLHFVSQEFLLSILGIAFFLTTGGEVIWLFRDRKTVMYRLVLVWVSTGVVILPLIVTSETGVRLFFSSNVLMILFAAMLLRQVLVDAQKQVYWCTVLFALAAMAVLMLGHGKAYSEIGDCKRQREAIIAQAVENGSDSMTLPRYPYGNYLWIPDPDSDQRLVFFKEFYGIPSHVTVTFE